MNRFILTITTLIAAADLSSAQEVKANMNSLLKPFKAIQPYLASQSEFTKAENKDEVFSIIQELRSNFHSLEKLPSKYHALPGFDGNLRELSDLLDDSSRRLSEGKSSYAWWRMRKLPSNCFTCHATYKVSSSYSNADVIDQSLDPLNKGRFMLATRQFKEAREEFLAVLRDPEQRLYYNEALRSLILITTRIEKDPLGGIALLNTVLQSSKLPEDDASEAREWIAELNRWSAEKPSTNRDSVAFAEQLITTGVNISKDTGRQNDINLLRGSAILHQQLEQGTLHKDARPRALYYLGLAYSKLQLFFSESWAEMYLERCIKESPGSVIAKRAFNAYREHILDDYTGAAGTEVPDDVQLHLEELRKKAYGEPNFRGAV